MPFKYQNLGHDLAVHCSAVSDFKTSWYKLHHRPTVEPSHLKLYSNASNHAYAVNSDSVADALTCQAFEAVNFPRTIQQMWDDGVRIFVEHGPRQGLSQAVAQTLKGRDFIAVAYDSPGANGYTVCSK